MPEQFQLRDIFNSALVERVADNIWQAWPDFERDGFVAAIVPRLAELNFGARSASIAETWTG